MCARSNRVGGTHHGHAVALTGKILGPLGLAWLILTGTWPPDTVILVLTNDLIWWIPFAWYLRDAWPAFRHGVPEQPPHVIKRAVQRGGVVSRSKQC